LEQGVPELFQTPSLAAERFLGGYFHTVAHRLDLNLPPATHVAEQKSDNESMRWPWGRTVAFAAIVSVSGWALLAGIIRLFS
jgi:hypothetical protein